MDPLRSTVELKDDTVIVVLGASGDLAKKKTVRNPCLDFSGFYEDKTDFCDSSQLFLVSYVHADRRHLFRCHPINHCFIVPQQVPSQGN